MKINIKNKIFLLSIRSILFLVGKELYIKLLFYCMRFAESVFLFRCLFSFFFFFSCVCFFSFFNRKCVFLFYFLFVLFLSLKLFLCALFFSFLFSL